jgi:hypothetical protein
MVGVGISMSLTYGTVLTEGYGWKPATVGLVNVSHNDPDEWHDSAHHQRSVVYCPPA